MKKIAVVLFNLGGPDSPEAVRPFLFNLFKDKAIIPLPFPARLLLATLIAWRRAPVAKAIYEKIGGKSPILELTKKQAKALEEKLNRNRRTRKHKVFVAMRYWHPLVEEVVGDVKKYKPDEIILLPLYPHFSGTTTGSSLEAWKGAVKKEGINIPTRSICCYFEQEEFIKAHVVLLRKYYEQAEEQYSRKKPRILFSAHGLPEKCVEKGDPYPFQIEKTAEKIARALGRRKLDYKVCYQSKVGKLPWIGPSTEEEIIKAGEEKIPLVVVPIAFVSEHSETLVELDMEYRHLAEEKGVPCYVRVPALGVQKEFIEALTKICLDEGSYGKIYCGHTEKRACNESAALCPCGVLYPCGDYAT